MKVYHINPQTGQAGLCHASRGSCPFGGEDEHYSTADDARKSFEKVMSQGGQWLTGAHRTPPSSDRRRKISQVVDLMNQAIQRRAQASTTDEEATAQKDYQQAQRTYDYLLSQLANDQDNASYPMATMAHDLLTAQTRTQQLDDEIYAKENILSKSELLVLHYKSSFYLQECRAINENMSHRLSVKNAYHRTRLELLGYAKLAQNQSQAREELKAWQDRVGALSLFPGSQEESQFQSELTLKQTAVEMTSSVMSDYLNKLERTNPPLAALLRS